MLSFKHRGADYTVDTSFTPDEEGGASAVYEPAILVTRDRKNPKSKLNEQWHCARAREDWDALDDLSLPPPRE